MSRNYKCAPLPFIGQKRYFIRDFSEVLGQVKDDVDTIVDLFGGSGLLSHTAKNVLPNCRVIYNDYDNYKQRINAVGQTNVILSAIKSRLNNLKPNQRLSNEERNVVLSIVEDAQRQYGWIDIVTIARSLLFSGKWATNLDQLRKHTMYNRIRSEEYVCEGYLDGLEITSLDFMELFEHHRINSKALFIVDPPYLSTECGMYKTYWKLADYLNVLKILHGIKYIYFTSDKSQIVELCQFLAEQYGEMAPLNGAKVHIRTNHLNHHSKYNDMMIINI